MMKKTVRTLALALCVASAVSCASCGMTEEVQQSNEGKENATKLAVYNYNGGFGTEWLYEAEARFEKLYEDVSFEDGKMGVDLEISPEKLSQATIATQPYDVFFTESVNFNDYLPEKPLRDGLATPQYGEISENSRKIPFFLKFPHR